MYDSSEISGQLLVTVKRSAIREETLHVDLSSRTASWDFIVLAKSDGAKDFQLASGRITLGTTDRLLKFSLRRLTPQLKPYQISFILHGDSKHSATTELYYLPAKNEGSSVKVDNLHGGLLVANNFTGFAYEPFIPFALSGSCSWQWASGYDEILAYRTVGVNTVGAACDSPAHDDEYGTMDSADMWYQYSLKPPSQEHPIPSQVALLKDHSNLLSWQLDTDQVGPFSIAEVYALLKKIDPYHPVGVAFSCGTSAEIKLSSDYVTEGPRVWRQDASTGSNHDAHMPAAKDGSGFQELVGRLDAFSEYFTSLGTGKRPFWASLKASSISYSTRTVTSEQLWAAVVLTFSHNAKAIMIELDSMDKHLTKAYGAIASAITSREVTGLMLSGPASRIGHGDNHSLDVSYWKSGSRALVMIANLNRTRIHDNISIELPFSAKRIVSQPWGSLSWSLANGTQLATYGLDGLATSILIFDT
jgi:hypothetical protein